MKIAKPFKGKSSAAYETIESDDVPEPRPAPISLSPVKTGDYRRSTDSSTQSIRRYRGIILTTTIIIALIIIILFIILLILYITKWSHNNGSENNSNNNGSSIPCEDRLLVVISIDGFRALFLTDNEYRSHYNITTPNLDLLIENGVHIKRINPVYPSLTFPNHYTMATGVYPGYHGIVANTFYDPIYGFNNNQTFQMSSNDFNGKWYFAEPIWQTVHRKYNKNKFNYKSATIFWVGSDKNCSGNGYPDYFVPFNNSLSYKKRCDIAIDLLKNETYRIIMMYFDNPDHIEHLYGPNSPQAASWIMEMDETIGYFINSLKNESMELYNKTDIMTVSDHGHMDTNKENIVYINKSNEFDLYYDNNNFAIVNFSPNLQIYIKPNSNYTEDLLIEMFNKHAYPNDKYKIYKKGEIPYQYNDAIHNRIANVIVDTQLGYQFLFNYVPIEQQWWYNLSGQHGWNNTLPEMSSMFVATGPSFKINYTKDIADNINYYELYGKLMCGLEMAPNNGSIEPLEDILR